MIRVTIELIPNNNETRKRTLGIMHIENVSGTTNEADFKVSETCNDSTWESYTVKNVARHANIFKFLRGLLRKPRGSEKP